MDETLKEFAIEAGFIDCGESIESPYVEGSDVSNLLETFADKIISETVRMVLAEHDNQTDWWKSRVNGVEDELYVA